MSSVPVAKPFLSPSCDRSVATQPLLHLVVSRQAAIPVPMFSLGVPSNTVLLLRTPLLWALSSARLTLETTCWTLFHRSSEPFPLPLWSFVSDYHVKGFGNETSVSFETVFLTCSGKRAVLSACCLLCTWCQDARASPKWLISFIFLIKMSHHGIPYLHHTTPTAFYMEKKKG